MRAELRQKLTAHVQSGNEDPITREEPTSVSVRATDAQRGNARVPIGVPIWTRTHNRVEGMMVAVLCRKVINPGSQTGSFDVGGYTRRRAAWSKAALVHRGVGNKVIIVSVVVQLGVKIEAAKRTTRDVLLTAEDI